MGCRVCEEKKRVCRLVVLRKDSGLFRMGFSGGCGFGGWGHAYFFNAGFFGSMLARSVPASVGCRVGEERKRACRLELCEKIPDRSAWVLVVVGALVAGDTPTFSTLDFWSMLARSVPASVGCRVCEERKRVCRLVVVRKDSELFRMGFGGGCGLGGWGHAYFFNAGFLRL